MSWKKDRIIRKLLASLLSLVFLIANPLAAKADWSQPEPPSTYLNPNEINANNPNPICLASMTAKHGVMLIISGPGAG